jgi:hypothetical protein
LGRWLRQHSPSQEAEQDRPTPGPTPRLSTRMRISDCFSSSPQTNGGRHSCNPVSKLEERADHRQQGHFPKSKPRVLFYIWLEGEQRLCYLSNPMRKPPKSMLYNYLQYLDYLDQGQGLRQSVRTPHFAPCFFLGDARSQIVTS